ncbi:MAG: shikimate kinase [Syntrophobacteraceae bacterium]|nr:shikimate kinase [Syntrophobacteraceae bacterium]
MKLTLIGMSGCGKSHWSKALTQQGFKCFACDELIARKLLVRLKTHDDILLELGEWMGFPYHPGYNRKERRYLAVEEEVIRDIVCDFESGTLEDNMDVVVDSTGSLIYLDTKLLERLKRHTTFVYFHSPPSLWKEMLLSYSSNPRPMVWNDMYSKRDGETNEQAMARCYEDLIASRDRLYSQFADITVNTEKFKGGHFDALDLLKEIQSQLPL